MGVVYCAEHAQSRARVALKTVSAVDPTRLCALRGEIGALDSAQHPGLARLLDHGVERGVPWYAMELLEGRTLRDLFRQRHSGASAAESATQPALERMAAAPTPAPHASLRYEAAQLEVFARLCDTLAFLHGRGIVHRDLKPENVFLRGDGAPVLMDLGIAARFAAADAREPLHPIDAAGSIAYMAPEQVRGELIDARADLYALGCMLYEHVAGEPPFTGSAADVARAHLDSRPVPLSQRVPETPAALARLVARLLAKRPASRPAYALEVARALDALVPGRGGEPSPRAELVCHLQRPAFVGRARDLARLQDAVERAARGEPGGQCFIAGESGIGKTRLAMEVARMAAARGLTVVVGACAPPSAAGDASTLDAGPLHLFAPLLLAVADRCRSGGPALAERLTGERASILADYQPALADPRAARPAQAAAGDARARILDALVATAAALAREEPLLLLLDDLQWADALSLEALRRLTETEPRALLVVGTYRSEEAQPALSVLASSAAVSRVDLGRLDPHDLDAMVSGLLAWSTPPEELLAFLRRRCEGNPFFVAECVRALIGDGLIERGRSGQWRLTVRGAELERPLPRTLSALIARRLRSLDAIARGIVRAAAVLGRELDLEILAEIAGRPVAGAVATLQQRQILEDAGPGRVRFAHERIREVTYARTSRAARTALHAGAAAALEARLGAEAAPSAVAALGHHFACAGAHDRAAEHLFCAGAGTRALHANEDAVRLFEAAARAARQARDRGDPRALSIEARAQEALGDLEALGSRHARARAAYSAALACSSEAVTIARLHRKVGKTWETQHRHDRALAAFDRAEAALGAPTSSSPAASEWIELAIDRIAVHYWRAEADRIAALAGALRPFVEAHGARPQRDRFFRTLVQLNLRAERYAASRETVGYAREYVGACERAGNEPDVASARCGLGTVLLWHGDLAGADGVLAAALASADRIGDAALRARCLCYLAFAQRRRRAVDATRELALRGLAAAEDAGLAEYAGAARANLAWVALEEAAFADAASLGRDALALWRGLTLVFPFQWLARLPLVAVALEGHRKLGVARHVTALLAPTQARLPTDLAAALEASHAASRGRRVDHARRAIIVARQHGYL